MLKTAIQVPSISCGHCKAAIESALREVDGVATVVVDVPTKEVSVEFEPTKIDLEQLQSLIEEQGHEIARS